MKKLNKILIIDNSMDMTGAIKAIVTSAVLLKRQHDFIFLLPARSKATAYVERAGFEVVELVMVEISKRPLDLLYYFPLLFFNALKLSRLVKCRDIEIIHMNDFYNMLGLTSKLFVQVKVITHVRRLPNSLPGPLSNLWLWLNYKLSDQIICVSHAVKNQIGLERAIMIYDHLLQKEKYPKKKIEPTPVITFLYLGNYIKGKGHDFALEAFHETFIYSKNTRLKYVGGNMGLKKNENFKQFLKQKAKKLGLIDVVSFNDFSNDVEREIKNADILLNFSEAESFSFTCLESLFYGVPVIASNCGGPAEIIENGVSGYLVENKNVSQMAKKMLLLSKDIEKRKRFSEEGRVKVKVKFSKLNTVELLNRVYNNILK